MNFTQSGEDQQKLSRDIVGGILKGVEFVCILLLATFAVHLALLTCTKRFNNNILSIATIVYLWRTVERRLVFQSFVDGNTYRDLIISAHQCICVSNHD